MTEVWQLPHPELQHNWKNKVGHIMRKKGHVVRCQIERLQIHEGETSVVVAFNENGKGKKKAVCPLMLAATNVLWRAQRVVSSDEEDDPNLAHPIPPPDFDVPLPALVCTNPYILNTAQQRKLKWKLAQVNNMLDSN